MLRPHALAAFAALSLGLGLACAPAPGPTSGEHAERTGQATRPVLDCEGSFSDVPSADGSYYATSFGCWADDDGKKHQDPGDNCVPGCLADAQGGLCAGMTGPECERHVKWFAADAARFGCLARLRVTNPTSGRAVVVVALDNGPSCTVEKSVDHAVLDLSYPATAYLFGEEKGASDHAAVSVEVVDDSTPLGPAAAATPGQGNGQAQGGGADGWSCDPAAYGDGQQCDCGCGADDPDCEDGACFEDAPGTAGGAPGGGDGAGGGGPAGWTCDPAWYADGQYCDASCGIDDPDCQSGGGDGDGAGGGAAQSGGAPAGWTCDPAWYADGQYCDCNCGVEDLDCDAGTCAAQAGASAAPDGWTCDPAWYEDGQYCDCGCGADDPDCGQGC